MTSTRAELEQLERSGWEALSGPDGAQFYDDLMTDDGFMVFPGMVFDRVATIAGIADAPPWASWEMADINAIDLGPEAGVITYRAIAQRTGEPVYVALMSSVYVRRDGRWRLALHQQTPS